MRARKLSFGGCELDVAAYELRRGNRIVRVERLPMELLLMLVDREGELVTRDEILTRLWGRDVCLDVDNGINTAIAKLRAALRDTAVKPAFIKTIPGKGYRFIAPVTSGSSGAAEAALPAIRSLGVLPLENLTGDGAQEPFVDALTDALITELAQIGGLRVISRTSIAPYKGIRRAMSIIAAELGVDAVLEGAVSRSDGRVRITAHLVYAALDQQLWARSYARAAADALTLQDDIADAIARDVRAVLSPRHSHSRMS
jgi:TolB-like protein